MKTANDKLLFHDPFIRLDHWHHEGDGNLVLVEPGVMRIECVGGTQGGVGCMAFCREDFPDGIAVEYDLLVHDSDGLIITFVGMRGLEEQDIIMELPPRSGVFKDYTGEDASMRSYHVSVCRYDDTGTHTGVSNWRRNPGLHLMAQGEDLCKETGQTYAVRIEKDGPRCGLFVDGRPGPAFTDPGELPDKTPSGGKVGFRAIGSRVIADIADFRVSRLKGGI